MAEKVTSMRLNEEDLELFKDFAKENGLSQQQAFNSLIALAELEKAKDILGDRAKSIDTFRDTINKALGMYLNALEENTTAEQTIREELSKELHRKDNTITNLYDQLQEVKDDNKVLEDKHNNVQAASSILREACDDLKSNIENLQSQLDLANRNNNTLQDQLTEYKEYKNINKQLQEKLEQLNVNISNKDKTISELENSNKQLQDKIKNDSDMIEFYKSNNLELKENIKALEDKHDKQIDNIKIEYEKAIQDQVKSIKEQLSNKYDVEIAKKDLEIEKLKNEVVNLKPKSNKTVVNKKSNADSISK